MNEVKRIILQNYKLIKKMYKLAPKLCVFSNIMVLITGVYNVYNIIFPQLILKSLLTSDLRNFIYNILIYLLVFILNILINYLYSMYTKINNEKLNAKIIDKFLLLSLEKEYDNFESIEFIDKFVFSFENIVMLMHNSLNILNSFLKSIFTILLIILLIPSFNVSLLVLIIITSLIQQKLSITITKVGFELDKDLNSLSRKINYIYRMFYDVNYVKDIKVTQRYNQILNKKNEFTNLIIEVIKRKFPKIQNLSSFNNLIATFEYLIFAVYFGIITIKGLVSVDSYFTNLSSYQNMKSSITSIIGIWAELKNNNYIADICFEFKNIGIKKHNALIPDKGTKINTIEFKNVSFCYPNQNEYVLKNISFKLNKGDKAIIIGHNGSGKSTIFKLILGLYTPTEGEILINDINLKKIDLNSYISRIECMLQDSPVYPFTIKDFFNDVSISANDKIFEEFGIKDFINNLPKTLNTPITSQIYNNGVEISGGQFQKIKIIKFLKSEKSLKLIDEPTNNLDSTSKEIFYNKIFNDNSENIKLIISHDFVDLDKFDKVLILEKGCLIS